MDFRTSPPRRTRRPALAARILEDRATAERMHAVEADGDRFDHDLWQDLADAGLLGLATGPEAVRRRRTRARRALPCGDRGRSHRRPGAGRDPRSLRTRPLAELGTDDQRELWLYGAATGERALAAAAAEDLDHAPRRPLTTARTPTAGGWLLSGTKTLVHVGLRADLLPRDRQPPPMAWACSSSSRAPVGVDHGRPSRTHRRRQRWTRPRGS